MIAFEVGRLSTWVSQIPAHAHDMGGTDANQCVQQFWKRIVLYACQHMVEREQGVTAVLIPYSCIGPFSTPHALLQTETQSHARVLTRHTRHTRECHKPGHYTPVDEEIGHCDSRLEWRR